MTKEDKGVSAVLAISTTNDLPVFGQYRGDLWGCDLGAGVPGLGFGTDRGGGHEGRGGKGWVLGV